MYSILKIIIIDSSDDTCFSSIFHLGRVATLSFKTEESTSVKTNSSLLQKTSCWRPHVAPAHPRRGPEAQQCKAGCKDLHLYNYRKKSKSITNLHKLLLANCATIVKLQNTNM